MHLRSSVSLVVELRATKRIIRTGFSPLKRRIFQTIYNHLQFILFLHSIQFFYLKFDLRSRPTFFSYPIAKFHESSTLCNFNRETTSTFNRLLSHEELITKVTEDRSTLERRRFNKLSRSLSSRISEFETNRTKRSLRKF